MTHAPASSPAPSWTGRVLLFLSAGASAAYFLSLLVIAMPALGGQSVGLSLLLAFASAVAAYASAALAALDAVMLVLASASGRPRAVYAAALVCAALPLVVLIVQHLTGR